MKVVVITHGGVVQGVYAPKSVNLDVLIADADEYEDMGLTHVQIDAAIDNAVRGLQPTDRWHLDRPAPLGTPR